MEVELEEVLRAVLPMSGLLGDDDDKGADAAPPRSGADGGDGEGGSEGRVGEGGGDSGEGDEEERLLTYDELFDLVNRNDDGYLVFEEFVHALKMVGVFGAQVSETEALHLFALGNEDGDGRLTRAGFRRTLQVIERRYSKQVLKAVGFDPAKLGRDFAIALLCLLLLFFFIFMGIEGFTSGGPFGAVVNSVLPIAGGFMTGEISSFGPSAEFLEGMGELITRAVAEVIFLRGQHASRSEG